MKYIRSVLKNNRFTVSLKLKFEGMEESEIEAILDTGCHHSHLSIDTMFIFLSDEDIKAEKAKYMRIRHKWIGTGVESSNQKVNTDINDVNNPRIILCQKMYDVKINNVDIGNRYMGVSYDTHMVALIGMFILKDWDIHIGKNKYNETVFLGCPYNKLNQEYYLALNNEFGIQQNINAAVINNQI